MARAELEAMRGRVVEARERLRAIPDLGEGRLGEPDPKTGERWNRLNALGHVAEMLPFWCAQIRAGQEVLGRGESGYVERRQGIDAAPGLGESELRLRVDSGINDLMHLLAELKPADLERKVVYRSRQGDEGAPLGQHLETLLVHHLEEHVDQLAELS